MQFAEQPSPGAVLPSSHCSPGSMCASPHIAVVVIVHVPPAGGQVQPAVTVMQSAEQPCRPVVVPSSHASLPSRTPSPHTIVDMHGLPGVGHAQLAST